MSAGFLFGGIMLRSVKNWLCEVCGAETNTFKAINSIYHCPRCLGDSEDDEKMKIRAMAIVNAFNDDEFYDPEK